MLFFPCLSASLRFSRLKRFGLLSSVSRSLFVLLTYTGCFCLCLCLPFCLHLSSNLFFLSLSFSFFLFLSLSLYLSIYLYIYLSSYLCLYLLFTKGTTADLIQCTSYCVELGLKFQELFTHQR